jgi:hypothetical protein
MPGRSPGLIESACIETGRGAEQIPSHDATASERGARISVEQQRLRAWAETNGKLKGKVPREDARGGEHTVQFPGDTDKANARVIRATRPDANHGYGIAYGSHSQGATPSEYLDRLSTQNRIFDDDVEFERVVPVGNKLSIVTSQPFIKGRDATQPEIDLFMREKGFEKIGEGTFYHSGEGLLVHDLLPKNAKMSQSGRVHPIDPVIQRVTPEFAHDLKMHPIHPINDSPPSTQPTV